MAVWPQLAGAAASVGARVLGGLLQKSPEVPKFKKVDVQEQQQKAIAGNIEAFPGIKTLGEDVNKFLAQQQIAGMETLAPGSTALRTKVTEELLSGLAGDLPKDVQDLIARRAAERGISTGTAGSQFAQFGELTTLGLTSLQRIQQSMDSATRWLAQVQSGMQLFDPTRFMVSPEFQTQVAISERDKALGIGYAKSQIDAAYAPSTIIGQALTTAAGDFGNVIKNIVGKT